MIRFFDRASAFTFEKYKEENDDEEDDEENYREFEEIKEMALFFRDLEMYRIDCYDYSQEEIEEERENIDEDNEILQLDYSLANLSRLREYKETNEEFYQECLNDSDLQNNLQEWRDLRNTPVETNKREFGDIKEMALYFRDRNMYYLDCYDLSQEEIQEHRELMDYNNEHLQLDYSLANLMKLREYKETNEEFYQECLNDSDLQNNLREWRRQKKDYNSSVLSSALFEQVRSIIAEQLNVDAAQVTPEAEFVKDLGADSLDVVELIMALEEKFGIEIPDEQAEKIVNVGDVVKYIEDNTLI
ncbi:hypothetical protein MMM125_13060 [Helicobacter pylori]